MPSPVTSISYACDGVQDTFTIPFEYIDREHVRITLNGLEVGFVEWLNDTTFRMVPVPAVGLIVTIYRITPVDARIVNFQDGVVLTEKTLDDSANQNFFLVQEMRNDINNIEAGMLGQTTIDELVQQASSIAQLEIQDHPDWGTITITQSNEPPTNPKDGDVWYDKDDLNKSYQWDAGTQTWVDLVTSVSGSLLVPGTVVASAIATGAIGADHISVNNLAAISADLGAITAGTITMQDVNSDYWLQINPGATRVLWFGSGSKNDNNAIFQLKSDGSAIFKGTLTAASGTFAGDLTAAGGTFAGELTAATGTFKGSLTADAIDAVSTLNIAGNAVTVPVQTWTSGEVNIGVPYDDYVTIQEATITIGVSAEIFVGCTFEIDMEPGDPELDSIHELHARILNVSTGGVTKNYEMIEREVNAPQAGCSTCSVRHIYTLIGRAKPGAGSSTYAFQVKLQDGSSTHSSATTAVARKRQLFLMAAQR